LTARIFMKPLTETGMAEKIPVEQQRRRNDFPE
jgi:hypothetical protein